MSNDGARLQLGAQHPGEQQPELRRPPQSDSRSWASPPRIRLNRIACAERQIRERRQHLSTRQNVRRAGLRKHLLSVGDVQQVAHTVVVRFQRRAIRLRRGGDQCGGGLPLPESGVQDSYTRSKPGPQSDRAPRRLAPVASRIRASACSTRLRRAPPSNTVQFRLNAALPVKSAVCPQGKSLLQEVERLCARAGVGAQGWDRMRPAPAPALLAPRGPRRPAPEDRDAVRARDGSPPPPCPDSESRRRQLRSTVARESVCGGRSQSR